MGPCLDERLSHDIVFPSLLVLAVLGDRNEFSMEVNITAVLSMWPTSSESVCLNVLDT